MTRLALVVLLAALAGPARVHAAAAPADTFETRALKDREETVESFRRVPMSPLAAIQRESLSKARSPSARPRTTGSCSRACNRIT
jgi:hypothetical protein